MHQGNFVGKKKYWICLCVQTRSCWVSWQEMATPLDSVVIKMSYCYLHFAKTTWFVYILGFIYPSLYLCVYLFVYSAVYATQFSNKSCYEFYYLQSLQQIDLIRLYIWCSNVQHNAGSSTCKLWFTALKAKSQEYCHHMIWKQNIIFKTLSLLKGVSHLEVKWSGIRQS